MATKTGFHEGEVEETLIPGGVLGIKNYDVVSGGKLSPPHKAGAYITKNPVTSSCQCSGLKKHDYPTIEGTCGIHAYHEIPDGLPYQSAGSVLTIVEGSGHVIMGDNGWRAEKACIKAIAVPKLGERDRFIGLFIRGYRGPRMTPWDYILQTSLIFFIPAWLYITFLLPAISLYVMSFVGMLVFYIQKLVGSIYARRYVRGRPSLRYYGVSDKQLEQMKKRFPDAVFYDSVVDMLQAYGKQLPSDEHYYYKLDEQRKPR